jgi:hypothetical protein
MGGAGEGKELRVLMWERMTLPHSKECRNVEEMVKKEKGQFMRR